MAAIDLERFVEECRQANAQGNSPDAILPLVARAVEHPSSALATFGEPKRAGGTILYRGEDITISSLVWGGRMVFQPHEHRTWSVIGVYGGREDNIFWKRKPGAPNGQIEAVGARSIGAGESLAMNAAVIHSVVNPSLRMTAAIHIYGGDFMNTPRSEWSPDTLEEGPFDVAAAVAYFESFNSSVP